MNWLPWRLLFLVQAILPMHAAIAIDIDAVNSLGLMNVSSVRLPGPWGKVLEDYVLSDFRSSRAPKVTKFGEQNLSISTKPAAPNKREVSETDLYLLGAIEKLVYRVDYLENRLHRAEELLYHIISGNLNKKEHCPANYTRVGSNCYHYSVREFDWKSSASLCRGVGGYLLEFDSVEEKQSLTKALQLDSKLKNKQFWTGGLNPGLLWIWASTAKPVNQSSKQSITGDGRCLKLAYNATSKTYVYSGEDCATRHRYICKLINNDDVLNGIQGNSRNPRSER